MKGEAQLKIRLPADAQTEINTVSANISLNGLRGNTAREVCEWRYSL